MFYDGSHTYDFSAALRMSAAKRRITRKELDALADQNYWHVFAEGTYRKTSYGYGRPTKGKPSGKLVTGAPTAEQLHRHMERFGSDGVMEVAHAYGLNMKAPRSKAPKPKRQRRTSAELRAQVLELHGRGLLPAAIADALHVGDRRVKELLAA